MNNFDLVIIGSGAAGFSAASRALDYKKNVCIIETGEIGGAGIMNGALVSKTMWELSSDYYKVKIIHNLIYACKEIKKI